MEHVGDNRKVNSCVYFLPPVHPKPERAGPRPVYSCLCLSYQVRIRGTMQSFFGFLKRKLIDEVGWEGGVTESGREREKRKKCIEMLTAIVARR